MDEADRSENSDHNLLPEDAYRAIDQELAQAEREMHDADAQLEAWHERQKLKKRQKPF